MNLVRTFATIVFLCFFASSCHEQRHLIQTVSLFLSLCNLGGLCVVQGIMNTISFHYQTAVIRWFGTICSFVCKTHATLSNSRSDRVHYFFSIHHFLPLSFPPLASCSMVKVFHTFGSHLPSTACRLLCGSTQVMLLCMKKIGPSVPQLISDIAHWTLRYFHVSQQTLPPTLLIFWENPEDPLLW